MQDARHYSWVREGQSVTAETVPSLLGVNATGLAVWRADTPHETAMAAPLGKASTAIEVYANHGRWIAECPECHDAQLAVRDDRRFMCVMCANAAVGGVWRPVIWPKGVEAIEAVLNDRPIEHRHWSPGETIEGLRREERREEPTDPREHAIWAGLTEEAADAWVRELKSRKRVG